jgi:hypothetical protein
MMNLSNVPGVRPKRVLYRPVVLRVRQEREWMVAQGMAFFGGVHNSPVRIRPHLGAHHRRGVGGQLVPVNTKAPLVFRERHPESSGHFLFPGEVEGLESGRQRTFVVFAQEPEPVPYFLVFFFAVWKNSREPERKGERKQAKD